MSYDLAALIKRANPNIRKQFMYGPDVLPRSMDASNLYRQCYKPVIDAWIEATPNIMAAYRQALPEMINDDAGTITEEIDQAQASIAKLLAILSPRVRSWALGVGQYVDRKWRGAFLTPAKVDLSTVMGVGELQAPLDTHIQWNVALIKDVSDQAQQRISNAVFDGLRNRAPAREIAKRISEATGMGRDRALRIASDQTSKLTGSLADERRREAGIMDWEWLHSKKKHPRIEHQERNGKYYTDEPSDVGEVINGKKLLPPPKDRPQQLPYCGCRSRSVIDLS